MVRTSVQRHLLVHEEFIGDLGNLIETPYYNNNYGFRLQSGSLTRAKKDTIEKGTSSGAEWYKFQLCSTFK